MRTSRPVLTYVGAAFVAAGLLVAMYFIQQLTGAIPGSPTRIDGRPIAIDGVGLTIFSTTKNAAQSCTAHDARGTAIDLKPPARHEQWDDAGDLYYVVAHSVDKVPAQTVEVACTGEATYFVGRRHTADVFLKPAASALAAFFIPGAIGAALIVVDQVRRRRRRT
ncbi:hypothetical protein ACWGID_07100 [Kribbella sp. NPDC054772]